MEKEIPVFNRIDIIRDALKELEGQQIRVKANMGRSRIVERTGTLLQAHPSLFVIEVTERRGRIARQTFNYVDVLTGSVQIYNGETGELLYESPED